MGRPRMYPRTQVNVPVVCELASGDQFEGVMVDVGIGGCRVECERPPSPGARLALMTRLPGSTGVARAAGIVQWSSGAAFGARVGLLDASDSTRVAELVASGILTALWTPGVVTDWLAPSPQSGNQNGEHDEQNPTGTADHP